MTGNIPEPRPLRWFERIGIEAELSVNLLPAGLGLKNWLFQREASFQRAYRGYRVFWLRGWVRVLGVFIGGGLFIRGEKL